MRLVVRYRLRWKIVNLYIVSLVGVERNAILPYISDACGRCALISRKVKGSGLHSNCGMPHYPIWRLFLPYEE